MTLSKIILLGILTVPVLALGDLTWLGVVAKTFYRSHLGYLMRTDIVWTSVIAFYVLFVAGLLIFAVLPAIEAGAWTKALLLGALFGFFTYMTYDLTNHATLKDWPAIIVPIDILWGTFLSGVVATVSFFIARFLA